MKDNKIPEYVESFLWSYDVSRMDLDRDKKRIITNVLNLGTKEATDWLFNTYSKREIREVLKNPKPGEWSRKSFIFWSLILGIKAEYKEKREIRI